MALALPLRSIARSKTVAKSALSITAIAESLGLSKGSCHRCAHVLNDVLYKRLTIKICRLSRPSVLLKFPASQPGWRASGSRKKCP
jgi:hypothetical protein